MRRTRNRRTRTHRPRTARSWTARSWTARPPIARLTTALLAVALAVPALTSIPAASAEDPPPSFQSSFEPGQAEPAWQDTAETTGSGDPKVSGVDGADSTAIPGDIRSHVSEVSASAEKTGEGAVNLADGDADSKWLTESPTGWARFDLDEPVAITRYALTSADDSPQRDPRDWTVQGSADGENWTTLDTRSGEDFPERGQAREFRLEPGTPWQHYRLDVTANHGAPMLHLSELLLANDAPTPPPPPNMRSTVGTGPISGYTNAPMAGNTGAHALRYQGSHTAAGHGFSYNKVFDVDLPVTGASELSYAVFPEFVESEAGGGDLRYPSTNVAVDLAFTDGTYLSELGAIDQYGFGLSPTGQGAAKSLSVNQWNLIRSNIGAVAAGRTVDRVLVAYDNAVGPASTEGWFDDIRIGDSAPGAAVKPSEHVLTTRGTNANSSFSRGNNIPATAVPHGFNFWTPVTDAGSDSWLYRYQEANNADNRPELQGFAASHEPSPWMGDRQTFQVMPSAATGVPDGNREARALPFDHDREVARPHDYTVDFDNGIRTEIAPTDHAAMFRFSFPGNDSSLIFDNVTNEGGLTLDPEAGTLSGYTDVRSGLSEGAGRMFVYATFDRPVTAGGMLPGEERDDVRGYLRFDAGGERTVNMRIATSLISVDQARHNLDLELSPDAALESVRVQAQREWDRTLGVVEVEGASQDQLTTLYSNLYRLFLYPNSGFENTGTAAEPRARYASPVAPKAGEDTPTETGSAVKDGEMFVNNGFWDTYRTTWPAYSLFDPDQAGRMADGFVQQYRDAGWISRWSSPGYANLMVGTSSDIAFADAFTKNVPGFDVEAAYDAAIKNATVTPPDEAVGRKGLDSSIFLGYTPTSTDEGMSWALEGYVNDYGIAVMSRKLYDQAPADHPRKQEYLDNERYFTERAQNYVRTFDPSVGFFQGRDEQGEWRLPAGEYDPRVWGNDYTETNGWNMAFTAPQDGAGLAALYGGQQGLEDKLDEFFATPETTEFPGSYEGVIHEMREARDVRMGQYGHSNQPSHHIPYMYDVAGKPSKTQAKVREVLSRLYLGSEIGQGYPGDEDNGEMSAWYVFSALGFYPLRLGSGEYAIGSPLFTKATVHLPGGKDLVVNAPENNSGNVYVQGLRVNGQPHDSTAISHETIAAGATLDFDMGPEPSTWGTGENAAPGSIGSGDAPPDPIADLTGPGKGTPAPGTEALFDDTSGTEAAVPAEGAGHVTGRPGTASMYTLTSPGQGQPPNSWVLQGSSDGANWSTVDERSGEKFAWGKQTRAFSVANPGEFSHYRLRVTGGSGLAELELLGKPAA